METEIVKGKNEDGAVCFLCGHTFYDDESVKKMIGFNQRKPDDWRQLCKYCSASPSSMPFILGHLPDVYAIKAIHYFGVAILKKISNDKR